MQRMHLQSANRALNRLCISDCLQSRLHAAGARQLDHVPFRAARYGDLGRQKQHCDRFLPCKASTVDPEQLPEARPRADPATSSAIASDQYPLWRRVVNVAMHGNEQGYYMGSNHWQYSVDMTPGCLLHEASSDFSPRITVRQHGEFRALRMEECLQSVAIMVDAEDGTSVATADQIPFGYIRAMASAAAAFGQLTGTFPGSRLKSAETQNLAVCLGVGGGGLPALIASHYPQTLMRAVDIDPVVIEMAHSYMSLSTPALRGAQNLMVSEGDAAMCIVNLLQQRLHPEVLFIDVYDSKGRIPASMEGPEFLRACVEVLQPGGILLANMFNDIPGTPARARLAAYACHLQTIVGRGNVYSIKVVNQEVNAILVAVKPLSSSDATAQPFSGRQIRQAARTAGDAIGFKFKAEAELETVYQVHADTAASFHEVRL